MTKLVLFLPVLVLFLISVSCDNAKIDHAESNIQVASEKACVPDAGCAGCPEAYARVSIIPSNEIEEVLKQKPKVIFIELGSTHFVPSQKMQLIMASLKQKYGKQIQVIFYDVMTPDQQKYAEKYDIKMIPTQLFLDSNGKELMRHEGFLPIDEIETYLKEQGLKVEYIAKR